MAALLLKEGKGRPAVSKVHMSPSKGLKAGHHKHKQGSGKFTFTVSVKAAIKRLNTIRAVSVSTLLLAVTLRNGCVIDYTMTY